MDAEKAADQAFQLIRELNRKGLVYPITINQWWAIVGEISERFGVAPNAAWGDWIESLRAG